MNTTSSKGPRVEVITSVERRRRWAPEEKRQLVEETYHAVMKIAYRLMLFLTKITAELSVKMFGR